VSRDEIRGPLAISVGVFDGVHLGHRSVLETLRREAEAEGARPVVVALDPHPLEVLRPDKAPPLLTTPAERILLLERFAAGSVLLHRFDRETAGLTPAQFLARLVPGGARLAVLVIGYDFRMGKDRSGGFEELTAEGERRGFRVVRVPPTLANGGPVSSTRIRELVEAGRVREAAALLGHPYLVCGRVVEGRGIGRTLHFPTANADVEDKRKLLPKFGVYAVHVRILEEGEGPRPGVMNLGVRPTFGASEPVLEVHLPGFRGDLLGKRLALEVVDRIREERTFEGPKALAARIEEDVSEARKILEES
jgi:riboflavin kinase/FMN adenylyltransferase